MRHVVDSLTIYVSQRPIPLLAYVNDSSGRPVAK